VRNERIQDAKRLKQENVPAWYDSAHHRDESIRMPFLSEEELAALHVEDLIFHVVGNTEADLRLMDEVAATDDDVAHLTFFLQRLRATNGGNLFDFISPSAVRNALAAIQASPATFVDQSKELARAFQNTHTRSTVKGVFLVMRLSCNGQALHAMMKYDHEDVLTYATEAAEGRSRAKVSRVLNTFVEKGESIQKSCIIRLTDGGGEVCVRDRSNRKDISEYFRSFLAVTRRHTPAGLTQKVVAAARAALGKVADELPPVVKANISQRIYEAVQGTNGFDPDDAVPFLTAIVGAIPEGSSLPKAFAKELARERIDQEAFDFDKEAVRRPPRRRIVTAENIRISYNAADQRLIREYSRDGRSIIEINSAQVTERDDEPETSTPSRHRPLSAIKPVAE